LRSERRDQTERIWLAALLGLTVLRLILAASLPLAPDEAYYWLWSQHLQAGYYDHPPMVAIFIRIGTALFGASPFGIRLLGPLAAAGGSLLLWRAGEDFCPNRHAGLIAAGLFNASIIAGVGAIVMTPDTPLILFWTATIAAAGRLLATRDPRWWLAIGVCAGLGLLSKYTAALLPAGIGLWLLSSRDGRRALATPWPWAGLALAFLVFAPNLAWNHAHGWVSYFKQGGREAALDPARSLQFLAELVFGQIALVTPVGFALMAAGIWRLTRAHNPVAGLLLWLTLLPVAIFLENTIAERVQANWPAIIYPAACIAAACLPEPILRRWLKPALACGFLLTLLVYAQAAMALFPLAPNRDPTALQLAGWDDFSNQVAAYHAAFVTSNDYATSAELAYHAPAGTVVAGFDSRWQYFNFSPGNLAEKSGILVTRRTDTPCPALLGTVLRKSPRGAVMTYRLCRITAATDGMILR
jgi:4-amino-4-deoxy-L-arabinose transferase-like glycosyltransferase